MSENATTSVVTMKELLEAGVHFGHQPRKWNPKMAPYIHSVRGDTHIIDLSKAVVKLNEAYAALKDLAASGKPVLFVGTKKQAEEAIKTEAERCGAYYVNSRFLGGTLTNFATIRSRVERMNKLHNMEKMGEFAYLPKKEVAKLMDEREKLEKNLRGIAEMTSLPGVLVVVDSKKEHIAVGEARKLSIPVIGIIDTNCDPDDVDVIIPANDDATRSVSLILAALADAVIEAKEGVELRSTASEKETVSMAAAIKTKAVLEQVEQKEDDGAANEKAKAAKNVNGDK